MTSEELSNLVSLQKEIEGIKKEIYAWENTQIGQVADPICLRMTSHALHHTPNSALQAFKDACLEGLRIRLTNAEQEFAIWPLIEDKP